jgi:glucose-1-phosphate adenylyltransferase
VIQVDAQGRIVRAFEEKPPTPAPLPGVPDRVALVSMGIYVFNAKFLVDELIRDARDPAPATTSATT